jgi:hypothetical protein
MRRMSDTVGEVMRRLFGAYDYVAIKDQQRTVIRKWDRVPPSMEGRKYTSFKMVDGMEMSKAADVPSDGMCDIYLLFQM